MSTQEQRFEQNNESVATVEARLWEEGFTVLSRYGTGRESIRRYIRLEDGKQLMLYIRWDRVKSRNIEHWEIFSEVSKSIVTVEYLAAFEEAIS